MSLLIKASGEADLTFVIDGGGVPIETGEKGHLRVPFGCAIDRVTMLADTHGSIQVDIWKSTLDDFPPNDDGSITGGNEPHISSDDSYEDADLEGWDKVLGGGDILAFNVDSVGGGEGGGTINRVTVSLRVRKS